MKAILTPDFARELIENESAIKNGSGVYGPKIVTKTKIVGGQPIIYKEYEKPIKCFPFEDFKGTFIQQRDVIPGMENEVADVSMAIINDNKITYKDFSTWSKETEMGAYSMMIYTPKFNEPTIFITNETLHGLFVNLRDYRLFMNNDVYDEEDMDGILDKEFNKYTGICTYILFRGEDIIRCGKWENKKYW